jgi:hypothetical protein
VKALSGQIDLVSFDLTLIVLRDSVEASAPRLRTLVQSCCSMFRTKSVALDLSNVTNIDLRGCIDLVCCYVQARLAGVRLKIR